jgi:hypothetical protein
VKFWKGERVVYEFDESGCWTQKDIVKVKAKKPEVRRRAPRRGDFDASLDVLPKRNEPGIEGSACTYFVGLENPAVRSNEYFIYPKRTMVFAATRERMVLNVYEGKARLRSRDQKWTISEGGMIYIGRGEKCQVSNKSKDTIVRLFQVNL